MHQGKLKRKNTRKTSRKHLFQLIDEPVQRAVQAF